MQRAVAIGAWEWFERDQLYKRLGRPCELKEGDFVPKVFYGAHIASPFVANLVANAKERAAGKAQLTTTVEKDAYRKAEDAAEVLAATELPGDPALKYLECLDGEETFKKNEYMPLIERLFALGGEVEDEDE